MSRPTYNVGSPAHKCGLKVRSRRGSPGLARWNDPDLQRVPAALLRSAAGNINTLGTTAICEADDLDPQHPQWRDGIDDGVWPLVDAITSAGFVTYDSSEGHPAGARDLAMKGVRVGVLPRDGNDAARISAVLCRAIASLRPAMPPEARIHAGRGYLRCETSGRDHPVVDLRLEPSSPDDFEGFYTSRERLVRLVAEAITTATHINVVGNCACMSAAGLTQLGRVLGQLDLSGAGSREPSRAEPTEACLTAPERFA